MEPVIPGTTLSPLQRPKHLEIQDRDRLVNCFIFQQKLGPICPGRGDSDWSLEILLDGPTGPRLSVDNHRMLLLNDAASRTAPKAKLKSSNFSFVRERTLNANRYTKYMTSRVLTRQHYSHTRKTVRPPDRHIFQLVRIILKLG
ncbi:hypothetical protein DPMN_055542 [Dreissena polymorpha]|uniref:Uncharacterized protein n=1 Tax=Dreissena polymorpha TaxID=45954 RepID=A0A9D4CRK5_DREPO|nr:hypothetical protein DPMN_055542 [Dreissena polymorpha]